MKKAIVIILSIYLSLVFFMPKKELVYTGLNTLSKQMINFEIEKANDFWVFVDFKNITAIYDKMRVANIEDVRFLPYLFYNRLTLTGVEPKDEFRNMLDVVVLNATLTYTVINPFKADINVKTTIGEINGEFDIKSSRLKLVLIPNQKFKSFRYKNYFRKTKGGYIYESIIR
jgi:hypothetical protein